MSYVHPIAGEVHPASSACNWFIPDGRSELCSCCDRSYREHAAGVPESWLEDD